MARKIALNLDREFPAPVKVGKRSIRTLKDAAVLYQSQPANIQKQQAWQTAWELIARAADDPGWMLFAEMALLNAANSDTKDREPVKKSEPVTSRWQSRRRKRDPWRD